MNKIGIYLYAMLLSLAGVALTGCSDDNEVDKELYGYVQFKVEKATTRSVDKLEYLADARKIKVFIQQNGHTIEQTLLLNSYNNENAEYGLRSDKLRLLADALPRSTASTAIRCCCRPPGTTVKTTFSTSRFCSSLSSLSYST